MKLFDREGTPNAARIRIVLAAKGLDHAVTFETVDLIAASQKAPEFLAMNPIGKTPVLLLADGVALSECTAITEYLDNLDGDPILTGRTPREKGLIHMMQRRVEIMLLDPVDDYFHYATPGLGPVLKPWRMPDWTGAKDWAERRGRLALANLPWFEDRLARQDWLAVDDWSMADITLHAAIVFALGAGLLTGPLPPALAAWRARFEALPAFANRTGQHFRPEDMSRRAG